jgi:hypothetical protein|tara:strand:+ start:7010 stop:7246 length:237 start_codon:yes stop_codon:yes gene_type:complete
MSEEQTKEQEQQEKVNQLIQDYKITFGQEAGQRVLGDLQNRCHLFTTTNVKGDAHESAFMEGQRAAILFILNMVNKKI